MDTVRTKILCFFNLFRFLLIIYLSLYALEADAQKHKLVFAAQWLPQAQFAGYYVARDQGFYEAAGIDVEIIHPTVASNTMEFLFSKKADIISLFLITALNCHSKNADIVNIAQLSQHSAVMFVSRKSSGIKTLNDFNGHKIGIWKSGFDESPKSLIKEHKLNVEWVPIHSSVNLFLMGGLDIMTVMWYNEYHQIYLSGVNKEELNTFFMSDFGYDIPEDGLYTLQNTLDTKREDLAHFVEASLKGWEYAAQNREYTVDLVVDLMRKAHISSNKAHQRWMLDKMLELQSIKDKTVKKTQLDPNDFNKAVNILKNSYITEQPCVYEDFFCPVLPGIR